MSPGEDMEGTRAGVVSMSNLNRDGYISDAVDIDSYDTQGGFGEEIDLADD
jgi:hypothetical protein